jgi:hypothetical protein
MTDQQHPITPPPELRRQWLNNDHFPMVTGTYDLLSITRDRLNSVMNQAAQWSADQELEACKQYMHDQDWFMSPTLRMAQLHNARRPKPPSLKEQALNDLDTIQTHDSFGFQIIDLSNIRRALEALPND